VALLRGGCLSGERSGTQEELSVIQARQLRAPRQPGGLLAEPALNEAGAMLERNRDRLAAACHDFLGRSFADLRRDARRALLIEAKGYLRRAGEPAPEFPVTDRFLLAGHQPELFHPGVWVKNFALNGLARAHGAIPVNLVVDNDTMKSAALKVPSWKDENRRDPTGLHRSTVTFDRWTNEVPYEERTVIDEAEFASFPERVTEVTRGWPFTPMLPEFWAEVMKHAPRTRLIGERFVAARRAFERHWGCHNLEVPLHLLCTTEPFGWFALHLLQALPRFHAVHNSCLREYRKTYGIRSRAHPVPDLVRDGDWYEAPLWAWDRTDSRRGRLMARTSSKGVELRAGGVDWPTLSADPRQAVQQWQSMDGSGHKLRSRALTTTLFARLMLSDLFIHGIGGAKYDELTDEIIRRFYDFEPPSYMVLSATLLLPLPAYPSHPDDCRRLARQLRDVHWNPQRHLPSDGAAPPQACELAQEKATWVAREPATAPSRRDRYRRLFNLTENLRPFVSDDEASLRMQHERCVQEVEANAILKRRDYAFCLYPEEMLRGYFAEFLSP
jgi:hypothetical protein